MVKDKGSLLHTGDSLKKYQYLACNVPVITSNCQKVDKKLKPGIFTYYRESDLKSVIEKVIYKQDSKNYRELVKDYSWDLIINKILTYVSQIH